MAVVTPLFDQQFRDHNLCVSFFPRGESEFCILYVTPPKSTLITLSRTAVSHFTDITFVMKLEMLFVASLTNT